MRRPDHFEAHRQAVIDAIARLHLSFRKRQGRRRPPHRDDELDFEPVEPPRPRPLSGGAAAELEYDE